MSEDTAVVVLTNLALYARGDVTGPDVLFGIATVVTGTVSVRFQPDGMETGDVGPIALLKGPVPVVGDRVCVVRSPSGGLACLGKVQF